MSIHKHTHINIYKQKIKTIFYYVGQRSSLGRKTPGPFGRTELLLRYSRRLVKLYIRRVVSFMSVCQLVFGYQTVSVLGNLLCVNVWCSPSSYLYFLLDFFFFLELARPFAPAGSPWWFSRPMAWSCPSGDPWWFRRPKFCSGPSGNPCWFRRPMFQSGPSGGPS